MGKYYTYIIAYGNSKSSHILPEYVPNRIFIQYISYETIETDLTSFLSGSNKNL